MSKLRIKLHLGRIADLNHHVALAIALAHEVLEERLNLQDIGDEQFEEELRQLAAVIGNFRLKHLDDTFGQGRT